MRLDEKLRFERRSSRITPSIGPLFGLAMANLTGEPVRERGMRAEAAWWPRAGALLPAVTSKADGQLHRLLTMT